MGVWNFEAKDVLSLVVVLPVNRLFQVILHDAVRPFVDQKTLHRVTIAASKHGVVYLICQ